MTLTAVLFVGGLSTRMGADKATLALGGEPLWRQQLNLLRQIEPQSLLISARERPVWCPPEIGTVLDATPSQGPVSGLAAALQQLQTSHLLALAVDLPRMTVEELRKLLALIQPGRGVVPMNGDYFEPLCAIYPAEAAPIVTAALASNRFSLHAVLDTLQRHDLFATHSLTEDEKPLFLNANTPGDLHGIC